MDVIILRPEFLSTNNDLALITHKALTSEHDKHVCGTVYTCMMDTPVMGFPWPLSYSNHFPLYMCTKDTPLIHMVIYIVRVP